MQRLLSGLISLCLCLWLGSCATPQPTQILGKPNPLSTPDTEPTVSMNALLRAAQGAMSPKREAYLVKAMRIAVAQEKLAEAQAIYQRVLPELLGNDIKLNYLYQKTSGQLFLLVERLEIAGPHFHTARMILNNSAELSQTEKTGFDKLLGQLLEAQGKFLASAELKINGLSNLSSDEATASAHEVIWTTLLGVPQIELERKLMSRDSVTQPELGAWLDLTLLMHAGDTKIMDRLSLLKDWKNRWSHTKVAQTPPKGVQSFLDAELKTYKRVAILLPMSGPFKQAGHAVLKGMLTSYYANLDTVFEQNTPGPVEPELRIYDTNHEGRNIDQVYNRAVLDGCDFIIGPLKKERVTALIEQSELSVPVVALNYINQASTDPTMKNIPGHHVQFGLSIEDETLQITKAAQRLGHRRALILFPETEWGFRAAKAFEESWTEFGGEIVSKQIYTQPKVFSKEIQAALEITQSKARRKRLSQWLDTELEFQPRRRQDIDMVFLAAAPQVARQLKPTLNFHYAQNVPVFSTSHIYEGFNDPKRNKDLNGIYFLDIPWVLTDDSDLKSGFMSAWPESNNRLIRLHALGIDAYHIMLYHGLITELAEVSLPGTTGMLHLNTQRKVQRELTWAQFKRGKVSPVTLGDTN